MPAEIFARTELDVPADVTFARICAIETWPVWLSFVRRADLQTSAGVRHGCDILLSSELTDWREEIFEIQDFIEPNLLTLVGAFSCRRQLQFKIERIEGRSHLTVRISYPVHGGFFHGLAERLTVRRRVRKALLRSLETLKGLVEHDAAQRAETREPAFA